MFDIVQPLVLNWKSALDTSETFFDGSAVAPPARLEYLIGLDQLVLAAATTPYPVTGLNFNAASAAGTDWYFCWVFAPGAATLRTAVVRTKTTGAVVQSAAQLTCTTDTTRIDVPVPFEAGTDTYPPTKVIKWSYTSDQYDEPGGGWSAGDNHNIELTEQLSPYVEKGRASSGVIGLSGEVHQVLDMTTL